MEDVITSLITFQVSLGKGLKARGNVEEWLGKVEEAMFTSLRRLCKAAIADYLGKQRTVWVVAGHPSQVTGSFQSPPLHLTRLRGSTQ